MENKQKNNIAITKATRVKLRTILLFAAGDCVSIFLSMIIAMATTSRTITFDLNFLYWLLFNLAVVCTSFIVFRVYFIMTRTAGLFDSLKLYFSVIVICILNIIFAVCVPSVVNVGTCLIYSICLVNFLLLIRFAQRIYFVIKYMLHRSLGNRVRAMIVGAGRAGADLVREIQTSDKINYTAVCIVDDDPVKTGSNIGDVKIAGTSEDIPSLAEKYGVKEILIAIPSAPKKEIKRIYEICQKTGCAVKILPGVYQFVSGEATVAALREVEISDLLGREQVRADTDEIAGYIRDQVVLVTGGGGSIGSELCRQIAASKPKKLIILDIYENNAYDIEQELRRHHPDLDLLALIASVRDVGKMEDVFQKYRPDIVFNAAAHKHVPLMETSPNEAVKNNVFGTLNCARLADKYAAKTFVQISTDKAVNPTNVMGATKRICEMIVQTIGRHSKNTNFVAVRFGNVLGSNGSVVPLFKRQIAEGGPVTVTDPNIIRYFMTIPEAVLLVLQAGAYAKGGQIFVLDMGDPVRIYDLAVNLIRLSGLEPGVDIEIKCTGLRPGEKLYEERLMDEEGLQTTAHGLISVARPIPLDEDFLREMLDKLYRAAYEETGEMRKYLSELVTTYHYTEEEA